MISYNESSERQVVRERSVKALQKAIKIVGSQVEIARQLNVAPELVNRWLKHSQYGVAPRSVIAIEVITRGKVSRFDLRCDLYKIEK